MRSRFLVRIHHWCSQILDPMKAFKGVSALPWFFRQWRAYAALPGAEPLRLADTYPQLHDRSPTTPFDPHYFYGSGWAMRRILEIRPWQHVDIGSHNLFANLLSAVVPVTFLDYRPLEATLGGLRCIAGSILELPFADDSVASLSCLHVAEHIGLGRYGDPLDPTGT